MNIESLLHRSRAVAGVLYAEDFDAPDLPSSPEPEAIEPAFSLAELEEARAEARAAARLDAEESQAAARLRALEAIGAGLDAARDTAREDATAASEAIARTMLGADRLPAEPVRPLWRCRGANPSACRAASPDG